ncbi:unnamed protein product [Prorocentrum cordatum]|uniref:Subtilisin n=1 Tax=Prorocentrum cordatum TaxID=2364126 RepID=A0ABN9QT43_9DINO|nr:unnamed protein product [Polarella glacialis]
MIGISEALEITSDTPSTGSAPRASSINSIVVLFRAPGSSASSAQALEISSDTHSTGSGSRAPIIHIIVVSFRAPGSNASSASARSPASVAA